MTETPRLTPEREREIREALRADSFSDNRAECFVADLLVELDAVRQELALTEERRHFLATRPLIGDVDIAEEIQSPRETPREMTPEMRECLEHFASVLESSKGKPMPDADRDFAIRDWARAASIRHAIADLESLRDQLATARQERDEYKTLAGIGAWHKDCRPNREVAARVIANQQGANDKLADTISDLRAQLTAAEARAQALTRLAGTCLNFECNYCGAQRIDSCDCEDDRECCGNCNHSKADHDEQAAILAAGATRQETT